MGMDMTRCITVPTPVGMISSGSTAVDTVALTGVERITEWQELVVQPTRNVCRGTS
jgi:hypothetical protein